MDWIGPPSLSVMSLVLADVNHHTVHTFRGQQNAALFMSADRFPFLESVADLRFRSQGKEHNIDEIDNDTSRPPPSTFNVTLTWTCSHFQKLQQLHESKLLKFLLLHV